MVLIGETLKGDLHDFQELPMSSTLLNYHELS